MADLPIDLDLDFNQDEVRQEAWRIAEEEAEVERAHAIRERAKGQREYTLADELRDSMKRITRAELQAAKKPHPHLFRNDKSASLPRGEVTILASRGREGKTSVIVAVAVAGARGRELGNQPPEQGAFTTVIFSAEDDRLQYAAKIGQQIEHLTDAEQDEVLDRIRIIDLEPIKARTGGLVINVMGQQQRNAALVEAMIEAAATPPEGEGNAIDGEWEVPLGLVVMETLSTLSGGTEDNDGLKAVASTAKEIARTLGVAVLVTHHTSQASAQNLATLDISRNDVRGGTALVDDTRQIWMLVNLGSDADPFPDRDSRTALRAIVSSGLPDRYSALICLDSSKSIDPPPVFFRWEEMRQVQVDLPGQYAGMHWRRLHRELGKARAEQAEQAKDEAREVEVRRVVAYVASLEEKGVQPTSAKVSEAAGRSPTWSAPYLKRAVDARLLTAAEEKVPRTRGDTLVYRIPKDFA